MRCAALAMLVTSLVGCATISATATAPAVLLDPPDLDCEQLGAIDVRMATGLLMPGDAQQASALNELRRRAAVRGATHLVVARSSSAATVAYGTTGSASGVAYRCPEWR